ncbi:MAG: dockerin type I domain-containing protein, partial [Planctomycetota bacterium]
MLALTIILGAGFGAELKAQAPFQRGDVDASGSINITDAILVLRHLFLGSYTPSCFDAADVNDSGFINIADPIYTLSYLFVGGPAPLPPLKNCGDDPSSDDLVCELFSVTICPIGVPEDSDDLPRVLGAISTGNGTLEVVFSKPMDPDTTLDPLAYNISQKDVQPGAGVLFATNRCEGGDRHEELCDVEDDECPGGECVSVEFVDGDTTRVKVMTLAQSQVMYTLEVVGPRDQEGNPVLPRVLAAPGIVIEPNKADFPGTGPGENYDEDTDEDGVPDSVEIRGYLVSVELANGTIEVREVTSDPFLFDTDGDGLDDRIERSIRSDPRVPDTDDDRLLDAEEFNYFFTSATKQDTDHDGVADGSEVLFFETSPILADTDGDQFLDGEEIRLGARNPRVADLPAPTIRVGDIDLQLDVRFTATEGSQTRELEQRSVTTTLEQSQSRSTSNSSSNTQESMARLMVGTSYRVEASIFNPGGKFTSSIEAETGWTGS